MPLARLPPSHVSTKLRDYTQEIGPAPDKDAVKDAGKTEVRISVWISAVLRRASNTRLFVIDRVVGSGHLDLSKQA